MLHLETGRRYVRRNGTITPPLVCSLIFFIDPEVNYGYHNGPGGNRVFGADGPDDPCDLMAEAQPQ